MTTRFQHTPDGFVIVESGANLYIDTVAHFQTDCASCSLTAYPGLSGDATAEIYQPGEGHSSRHGIDQREPTLDPALLDTYIAATAALLAAKAAREA